MGRVSILLTAAIAAVCCAAAGVAVGRGVRRRRKWGRVLKVVREFEDGCEMAEGRLRQVVDAVAVEMQAGLASDGGSKLGMLLSFVDRLPEGSEKGIFYALDLGGTNFRVLRVDLGGRKSTILRHHVERQPIPRYLLTSSTEELFDFIATKLKEFVEKEGTGASDVLAKRRELGFTFSFPVRQTSVSSGALINWTKGFAIADTVGRDVSQCLQEAMIRAGLEMRIAALLNDTVGLLLLGNYHDADTVAAVVIGTGTNASYVERTDAIIKCQGRFANSGSMVVNMEWGSFWSSHLPRTSYDLLVDDNSPNRNEPGFEEMISGMYLGEVVRRVINRMAQESDLFGDATPDLSDPFTLGTPMIAAMCGDDSPDLNEVARILKETLQVSEVPMRTRRIIVKVCDLVTRRAARLVAAGVVGILKKIGRDGSGGIAGGRSPGEVRRTVVAIEGGLYSNYAMFKEYLNEAVREILGDKIASNVILKEFEDGSGIGAAILAALYTSDEGRQL